jgi:hypothetical protein
MLWHQVAAGGSPAAHLAFWLEHVVGHYVLQLALGVHALSPPASLLRAGEVLLEVFSRITVLPNSL